MLLGVEPNPNPSTEFSKAHTIGLVFFLNYLFLEEKTCQKAGLLIIMSPVGNYSLHACAL